MFPKKLILCGYFEFNRLLEPSLISHPRKYCVSLRLFVMLGVVVENNGFRLCLWHLAKHTDNIQTNIILTGDSLNFLYLCYVNPLAHIWFFRRHRCGTKGSICFSFFLSFCLFLRHVFLFVGTPFWKVVGARKNMESERK